MKQVTVDRPQKKLSVEILTMKIDGAESPLAVCIKFLWRNFRWAWLRNGFGYDRVTSTIGYS